VGTGSAGPVSCHSRRQPAVRIPPPCAQWWPAHVGLLDCERRRYSALLQFFTRLAGFIATGERHQQLRTPAERVLKRNTDAREATRHWCWRLQTPPRTGVLQGCIRAVIWKTPLLRVVVPQLGLMTASQQVATGRLLNGERPHSAVDCRNGAAT